MLSTILFAISSSACAETFGEGIALVILSVLAGIIIFTILCSWGSALVMLGSGAAIKLANRKLGWCSFRIYSNVLLITGAMFTAASIVHTLDIGTFYGIFSVGLAAFTPPAIIGVLLELIYREKRKMPLRVFGIILIVIAALLLALTIGVMIWMAVQFAAE